jgi:hypothetical protein
MFRAVLFSSLIVSTALARPASDSSFSDENAVMREVSSELQICSAYDAVMSRCMGQQEPRVSVGYDKSATNLERLARDNKYSLGQSPEAYGVQSEIYRDAMLKATSNCANLAILEQRYATFCQRLEVNVDGRVREWTSCVRGNEKSCGGPGVPQAQ